MKSILDMLKDVENEPYVPLPMDEYETCPDHGVYQTFGEVDGMRMCIAPDCPKCNGELKVKAIIGKSGIQKRFISCSFDNYVIANESQAKLVRYLREYADRFKEALADGKSFVLSGSVGTGKTHLACALANQIARSNHTPYFATVSDIIKAVKGTWNKQSDKTEEQVIIEFTKIDLLIIDEVGATADNENDDRIIFDVINARYAEQLPTICLTNLPEDKFILRMGERIADRLSHDGKFLTMKWNSYRKEQNNE